MSKQKIEAVRDGRTCFFDPVTWNIMPDHKYGWTQVESASAYTAPPPIVQAAMKQKEEIKKARKPRKNKA